MDRHCSFQCFKIALGNLACGPKQLKTYKSHAHHIQNLSVNEHTLTSRSIDPIQSATPENVKRVTDFHGPQSGTQKSLGGTACFLSVGHQSKHWALCKGRQHAVVKLARSQAGHPACKICRNKFGKPCSKRDATQLVQLANLEYGADMSLLSFAGQFSKCFNRRAGVSLCQ